MPANLHLRNSYRVDFCTKRSVEVPTVADAKQLVDSLFVT